jgi:Flp pilus assembly protein TadB
LVEVGTVGVAIGAVLADRFDTWRSEDERRQRRERAAAKRRTAEQKRQAGEREVAERRHTVEPSLQRTAQPPDQGPSTKPPGYERELWERGSTGPERSLEPES